MKVAWRLWIAAYGADFVIPVKAGVQKPIEVAWIPACAGMTRTTTFQHSSRGEIPLPENFNTHGVTA
ncbi:MAG: hypothetical protein U9Q07_15200 [Planctomycetota bacterium]|nr:hypothetical protein [Planctomycetota bacterium]